MALIYANAVNKRMGQNNPALMKRKKSECCRNCPPCPYADTHHKHSLDEKASRKKSSTGESVLSSSDPSSNVQSHSTSPLPPMNSAPKGDKDKALKHDDHRSVVRSKTTCCDLSKGKGESSRKTSTPVFGSNGRSSSKQREEIKAQAKKQIIQKYHLEHELPKSSTSVDEEEEDSKGEDGTPAKKEGALARMKRKFSNWKI